MSAKAGSLVQTEVFASQGRAECCILQRTEVLFGFPAKGAIGHGVDGDLLRARHFRSNPSTPTPPKSRLL